MSKRLEKAIKNFQQLIREQEKKGLKITFHVGKPPKLGASSLKQGEPDQK